MTARARVLAALLVLVPAGAAAGACSGSSHVTARVVRGGDADAGKRAISRRGCGSCHEIPGVKGANGLVGPPLQKFGRRSFIAGELSNTPDNLIRWVRDPKGVEPGTDMPDLGIGAAEARNIAAYLERLG